MPGWRGPVATRTACVPEEEPGQAGIAAEAGYGSGPCGVNLLGLDGRRPLPGGGSGRGGPGHTGLLGKGGRKSFPGSGTVWP